MTARKILFPALPLVFVVVALGAFTRLSDAGLGCPDWPACYGQLLGVPDAATALARHPDAPLDARKAWIEVIHRYAAAALGLLVLAALIVAVRRRESGRGLVGGLAALVLAQALLGALTVTEKLLPVVVAAHLLGGMTILFLVAFLVAREPSAGPVFPRCGWGAAAVLTVAVQIVLGGWVSANYAGLACGPDFPRCQGALVPPDFTLAGFAAGRENPQLNPAPHNQLAALHFVHRAFAVVVVVVVAAFAVRLRRAGKTGIAQILIALLTMQIFLGIAAVVFHLPFWAALGHNAGAAALTAALAFALSHPSSHPPHPS